MRGVLRPGYSHVSDSVSELLSLGAPDKAGLVAIQVIYALFHVLLGLGIVGVVRDGVGGPLGAVGAWTVVAIAAIGTAVFPHDAERMSTTNPGRIHKALVFGVLIPASIRSTLLVGPWS